MKLVVLLVALGATTPAFADDYDTCVARLHALEAQIRTSPPSAQIALQAELPMCREATPPVSSGRLTGELVLGAAAGVGGGFLGAVIGYNMTKSNCTGEDFCGLGGLLIGGYLGATLAPPLAVYGVGAYGDQTGSLAATYGGALLGGAVGLAAGIGIGQKNGELGFVVAMAGPVVGATIGFNLTRHDRAARPAPVGSLLRVDDGHLGVGVPIVAASAEGRFVSLASGSW